MDFLDKVKKELRPDTTVIKEVDLFINGINAKIKAAKIKAVCVPGGSVAKGTFLKDDFDIDLFVKFDYSYQDKNISDILWTLLKGFRPERLHGSRDYFQIAKGSLNFEIVPVLDVADPRLALNVTDMSPMHVSWVKKNIKKGQEDDIRLAKKFCKVIGVYGAESYIRGFSGHVLDILVIHYGGFLDLLKGSSKWKSPVVIDPENHYKDKRDVLFSLNKSKIEGPMVIVDPLLKTRNAASALSDEKLDLFRKKAALFLKKPDESYFRQEIVDRDYLRDRYKKNLYIISLETSNGKKDVIGSKILKAFELLKINIEKKGFNIKSSGWSWQGRNQALYWFVFHNIFLPAEKIIAGPPLEMKDHVAAFREKYRSCFVKDKKIYAKVKDKLLTPEENIRAVSAKYFEGRVKLKEIEKYI